MKLTKRQKRIILISTLLLFLVLIVATSVLIANKNKTKVSSKTPAKKNLPNDKPNLTKNKSETITFLEQKLSSNSIKNEALLRELKNEQALKAGETNLKEYIEGATTPAEL